MTPRVAVLMSTYNGMRYLPEQVESVLAATDADVHLVVRDDGSTDGTPTFLAEAAADDDRIELVTGDNIGVAASFGELLRLAPDDCDYFAFSDQDDVWEADRLSRAASALASISRSTPAAWGGTAHPVSADLTELARPKVSRPSVGNALVENVLTGCTIVMNGAARELLLRAWPDDLRTHDAWLYLTLSACGAVLYDPDPGVRYRQHGDNVIGTPGRIGRWVRRLRSQSYLDHYRQNADMAQHLIHHYASEIHPASRRDVDLVAASPSSWRARLAVVMNRRIRRQRLLDDIVARAVLASATSRRFATSGSAGRSGRNLLYLVTSARSSTLL